MKKYQQDSRVLRRTIYTGLISFIIGFAIVFLVLQWLVIHFTDKDTRWWTILHFALNAILISAAGGLVFAFITVSILDWCHYRLGFYRCQFCGKPFKNMRTPCDCPQSQDLKR